MARVGTALIVLGVLAIACGAVWRLGFGSGHPVSVPAPQGLPADSWQPVEVPTPSAPPLPTVSPVDEPSVVPAPAQGPAADALPPVPSEPSQPSLPSQPIRLVPADAEDRARAVPLPIGYAVRLAIPAIDLDTPATQAGIVEDADGNASWQTLPFVAVHYGDLTSLIGARGNAVIAGHVVTLREGNVFRFLYRVGVDDRIQVWDDGGREHDFRVVDLRLVSPSDISVMAATPDETLTLITCGGTFDAVRRQFSHRLVVTAKPLPLARAGGD